MTTDTDFPAIPDFLLVANRKPLSPELQAKQDAILASLRETRRTLRDVEIAREREKALKRALKQPQYDALAAKAAEEKAEKDRISAEAKAKLAAWKAQHGWK